MSLGTAADIPVQVRNLESTTQDITLGLEGYDMATFMPADGLTIDSCGGSDEGQCAKITLSPGEQRTIYVRVIANDITTGADDLKLTAMSTAGVPDWDVMSVIVGYPADFPAMDAWWAVLLMTALASLLFYRHETFV